MNQEKQKALDAKIKEECANTAGVIISRDGEICYEAYYNHCHKDSTLHIYSVTKSIVSILIGIAIDQGLIKSMDQKILEFFPEINAKQDAVIQKITLHDLMTMQVPYCFEEEPYEAYFTSDDWVTFALENIGGTGGIGSFRYAAIIGPDILTGILVRVTGKSVLTFAQEQLFTPLGIDVKQPIVFQSAEEQFAFNTATDISGWVMAPNGVQSAGWGLTLRARDMMKLGELYQNEGVWHGQRIVSSEWIKQSTCEQSRWEELDLSYGYLWWLTKNGYAAMGDGGNVIYVNPKKRLVVSMLSLYQSDTVDRIDWIEANIEPLFE